MAKTALNITFQFMGDQFAHAWYFNRFRCDPLNSSILVTTALMIKGGGTPAVNGFVISRRDLDSTKERSDKYFREVASEYSPEGDDESIEELRLSPSRVYPVNHVNLSRVDDVAEICLYRYAMNTMLNTVRSEKAAEKKEVAAKIVPCYPVVMFRSDARVQVALLKELFSL